jgi:hypothetical protein
MSKKNPLSHGKFAGIKLAILLAGAGKGRSESFHVNSDNSFPTNSGYFRPDSRLRLESQTNVVWKAGIADGFVGGTREAGLPLGAGVFRASERLRIGWSGPW